MSLITISIKVKGKVQGVYYRQSTKNKALALGLTGTVENANDGSVLITATGVNNTLDELIEWCKTGPKLAMVTNVIVHTLDTIQFKDFTIIK